MAVDVARVFRLLCFTGFLGVGSAFLALLLGAPFGYFLTQISVKSRHVIEIFVTIPFLLPPLLVAMGFSWMDRFFWHGKFSPLTLIFIAQSLMNFGLVGRTFATSLSAIPKDVRENAALDGLGWIGSFFRIEIWQIRSAITQTLLLVSLYCSTSFGLVLILGGGSINTLETEINTKALFELNLHQASLLAVGQTILTLAYFILARRSNSRGEIELGQPWDFRALGPHGAPLIVLRVWGGCLLAGVLILLSAPFISSFHQEGRWQVAGYSGLFGHGARDLLNISVLQATENSIRNMLVALLISVPLAWLTAGARNRYLDLGVLLPIGLSSVVLGLGYLLGFGWHLFPLRQSWLVVPLAQSIVLLPLIHQLLVSARRSLDGSITEAADLDGAGSIARTWRIEVPILRRAITTALGFGALVSLGEFGAASFLAYGDQSTLPVVMFRLASRPGAGNFAIAMAASSLFIVVTAVVLFLSNREYSRYE